MKNFINDKVMPVIMRIINTTVLQSLKDGMVYIMPVLIAGSFALLLACLPITPLANFVSSLGIDTYLFQAYGATYEIMALIVALGITYVFVNKRGYDGFPAAVISMVVFILLTNASKVDSASGVEVSSIIDKTWTSSQGMIGAILVAFYVGYLYCWFMDKDIRIKMPESVPQNISNSFSALIPAVAIIFSATVIYAFFDKVLSTTMIEWLYATIQKPLQGITDSLGGIIVISLTMPFLWFFGIHGTTIVNSIVVPFLRANYMDNQAILASGLDLTLENGAHIVTEQFFDNILMLSGTGIVGGIVIYLLFFAKSKQCKELGKLAAIPNLFNINEPILFGIPIVFNPIMAIPFFLVPLTSALVSYFAIYVGLVPFFTGVVVPWTVPPVISGFLLGGWRMALLQVVILLISFTMYFPFIRKVDMMNLEMEKAAVEEAVVEEKASQN